MINLPNFEKLRQAIKTNREHFDMGDLFVDLTSPVDGPMPLYNGVADLTSCGTAACLCGWAYGFSENNGDLPTVVTLENRAIMWSRARYWLGLNDYEASYLFEGEWSTKGLAADVDETIAYLDQIIDKGELPNFVEDEPEERY